MKRKESSREEVAQNQLESGERDICERESEAGRKEREKRMCAGFGKARGMERWRK